MESGFMKADSANLPKVDANMVANFFASNASYFCSAEFRNAKTSISSRQSYGDDAIGYVQLKRDANLCVVKCKICPEHKVRQQPYSVSMFIDEKEGVVQSVQCADCPASNGCCKHAVAFLMWTHRRSEEPSCTATTCYWQKSKLSRVGNTLKYIKIKEMADDSDSIMHTQRNDSVLCDFLEESKKRKLQNCQILKHQPDYEVSVIQLLSMHYLSCRFNAENDCDQFINKICAIFTEKNVCEAERLTCDQHKSPAWHELRYARITASTAFDVTRCKTLDGSLIAKLMGAKVPDTVSMKRGRELEEEVKNQLKKLGEISQCGLYICPEYPMIAASPDGVLNGNTVIEIKCPINEKTSKKYISDNQVTAKYFTQVQLQMHLTKLKKCLFCVASWDFEETKKVHIVAVEYDSEYVKDLLCKLEFFWKKNVYPLLYNSTK